MCHICDALGLIEAECNECGNYMLCRKWDEAEDGPISGAVSLSDPRTVDSVVSARWLGAWDPDKCEICCPARFGIREDEIVPGIMAEIKGKKSRRKAVKKS